MIASPRADSEKMLKYREFDGGGLLRNWSLSYCNITALPETFGVLVCSGGLFLHHNKLESLPVSFGNVTVGLDLDLSHNKLLCLPQGFEQIKVGTDLYLGGNEGNELYLENEAEGLVLVSQTGFPNVKGQVK